MSVATIYSIISLSVFLICEACFKYEILNSGERYDSDFTNDVHIVKILLLELRTGHLN